MHNFRVMMHLQSVSDHVGSVTANDMPKLTLPSMNDMTSFHTFVVWTYPEIMIPQHIEDRTRSIAADEILLCAYPPCASVPSERINLKELTRDTAYQDFILDHALYKAKKMRSYRPHVQSIAVLSLVMKHPDKCARTFGDPKKICAEDLAQYASYDPTKSTAVAPFNPKTVSTGLELSFSALSYESKIKLIKEANVEDEVQSLVAAQFLPYLSSFIDRDTGLPGAPGYLLANARFRAHFKLPNHRGRGNGMVAFPSIQVEMDGKTSIEKNSQLVKASGPIGAQDVATLEFLQEHEIPSYLALSFTLMWDAAGRQHITPQQQQTSIVLIDVPSGVLPAAFEKDAITVPITLKGDQKRLSRLDYTYGMLKTCQTAKVVVTSRIQTAMVATAMSIPVIYVGSNESFEENGVNDMFYIHEPGQTWDYDLDDLTLQPGVHRADRARASFWNVLKRRSSFYSNTAILYGMVPLQRIGQSLSRVEEPLHNLFHFIFTTPPYTFTWREKRAIEYVFYHHPNAKVIVHSNSLPEVGSILDIFGETGYDLVIQPYNLPEMLKKTISDKSLVDTFVASMSEFLTGPHWYSHETDILRYIILWHDGGVYLDTDMYLVKPLPTKMKNIVAYQDPTHEWASGAVMVFEQQHNDMLQAALEWILVHYAAEREAWPVLGSGLVTRMHHDEKYTDTFEVMDDASFYPIGWESIDKCFTESFKDLDLSNTFGVHLNTKITSHYTNTTNGTFCDTLLHQYCIFCDESHTVVNPVPQTTTSPESKPNDEGQSLFSRFVSSVFVGKKRQPPPPQVVNTTPQEPERKYLPPVYMEFVRQED
jgi:hypothetical protein